MWWRIQEDYCKYVRIPHPINSREQRTCERRKMFNKGTSRMNRSTSTNAWKNDGTKARTNERTTDRPSRKQRNGRATDIAWWRDQTTNENERPRHPRKKKGTDELLLDRRTRQQTKTNRGKQRLRIYKIQIAQLLNHWDWLPNKNIFPAWLGATSQQPVGGTARIPDFLLLSYLENVWTFPRVGQGKENLRFPMNFTKLSQTNFVMPTKWLDCLTLD